MIKSLLVFALLVLVGCKKEEQPKPEIGLEYYPETVGFYRILEVDSLYFNDFTESVDTFHYFVKHSIVENYSVDDEIRTRVVEQRKEKLSQPKWIDSFFWSFQKDNFTVEENTNNLPKIVLTFPVKVGISWNSNVRNSLAQEDYTIVSKQDETINEKPLNDVITVEKFNETDPLQLNTEIGQVKFAPNVGLVYSFEKRVKRFTTGEVNDIPVDSGFAVTKQIVEYGLE